MAISKPTTNLIELSTKIVSGYVANHQVNPDDFESLLQKAHSALLKLSANQIVGDHGGPLTPAVPISESVKEDYIVCLEDGKRLQMLKRHLKTVYKISIEEYKERWGLPHDYPVVAPSYAKRRSQIAKNTGLGVSGRRKKTEKPQMSIIVNK